MEHDITDTQIRAARELLRWDQERLAEDAKVKVVTIRRFETGSKASKTTIRKIREALERGGIVFVSPSSIGGRKVEHGVALAEGALPEPRPKTRVYAYKMPRLKKETGSPTAPPDGEVKDDDPD